MKMGRGYGGGGGNLERGQKEASLLLEVMDVTAISSFNTLNASCFHTQHRCNTDAE